jgi:hypothetical protein|tara:strand:+ start:1338 stop:1628 length:291 start_codon:yes stop_codon:yes gene_type:complete
MSLKKKNVQPIKKLTNMILLSAIGTAFGAYWMLKDTKAEWALRNPTMRLLVDILYTIGIIALTSTTGTQGALFVGLISGFVFTTINKYAYGKKTTK